MTTRTHLVKKLGMFFQKITQTYCNKIFRGFDIGQEKSCGVPNWKMGWGAWGVETHI